MFWIVVRELSDNGLSTMRTSSILGAAVLVSIVAAKLVAAQDMNGNDPCAQPDESWISISGTVVAPNSDSFTLDYGEGLIAVETAYLGYKPAR